MTLEEFNSNYIYQSDKDKFNFIEVWEIPKEDSDGKIRADCESYCRYLKANILEFKDWDYYYCKLNEIGHCILYKNGDVIDCNIKNVITLEQYYHLYKVSEFKKYNPILIFIKIALAKLFTLGKGK